MKIEVTKEKYWFYRLVAKNGQTVLVSETFLTKWNAKRAAKKLAKRNNYPYIENV